MPLPGDVGTIQGRILDGLFAPTPLEMFFQLARENRWSNATIIEWTVTQHLLLCALIARERAASPLRQLYCLCHDAVEMVIRDVPANIKLDAVKKLEAELLAELFDAWRIPQPGVADWRFIHEVDAFAAAIETNNVVTRGTYDKTAKLRHGISDDVFATWDSAYRDLDRMHCAGPIEDYVRCNSATIRVYGVTDDLAKLPPVPATALRTYTELRAEAGLRPHFIDAPAPTLTPR